jgi:hypothetical protein
MLFNTNYTPGKNLRRSKAPGRSPHIYSFMLYFTQTITHSQKHMRLLRSRMRAVCCACGLIFFCCCSSIRTPRARIVTTLTMTPPRTSSKNVFVWLCDVLVCQCMCVLLPCSVSVPRFLRITNVFLAVCYCHFLSLCLCVTALFCLCAMVSVLLFC